MEMALLLNAISPDILHLLYFQTFDDAPVKYFDRF